MTSERIIKGFDQTIFSDTKPCRCSNLQIIRPAELKRAPMVNIIAHKMFLVTFIFAGHGRFSDQLS